MKAQIKSRLVLLAVLLAFLSRAHAQTYVYTPTNCAGAGVTNVVQDMLLWYNANGYYTNGPITLGAQIGDTTNSLGNWEPYTDMLGDKNFLIGATTFADDGTFSNQRYVFALQNAAGGNPRIGDEFYADNGLVFRQQINLSRQNGNPQRVAGDHRPGATNFLSMAETSAGQLTNFQSNARWTSNSAMFQGQNRYVTEQLFSLTPGLGPKPVTNAWDYVYGPTTATALPTGNNAPQLSRTGGKAVCLDNGNFAVVIDDKTCFSSPAGEVTTFSIITPKGAIVKGPTLVDPNALWDNVAAFSGGFAVRVGPVLHFFDDSGNPTFTNNVEISSGLSFDTGRGDGARIGSDIRSHYVYLAGATPSAAKAPVSVAIWDARTGLCVATNTASDTDPTVHSIDRVTVAVDASDRFCVVYDLNPDPTVWSNFQIAARIGKFDGSNVWWLTPSFFPFVNSENDPSSVLGFLTETPSVTMTTNFICIAGKGTVNSTNNASAGPDTAAETTLYTVITQPAIPGGVETAGLTNIVPDVALWYSTNRGGYLTNGFVNLLAQEPPMANWEGYSSVLGDSDFLLAFNTFADDGTFLNQRAAIAIQPAAGGPVKLASADFSDAGAPFNLEIDLSRQNGNPSRVGGDKRYGAVNFLTAQETSAGQITNFESNARWTNNPSYQGQNRYVTEQPFALNPATLAQTPLADVWDYVYGPLVTDAPPNQGNAPQLARTGGTVSGLDNGNFAVVIDDKTSYSSSGGEVTTFSIITPKGQIVQTNTLVDPRDIWDNSCAYSGGFAVRVHNLLYFYDNSGNPKFTNDINLSSGLQFGTGREDASRVGSDIRSHYVYLAGQSPEVGQGNVPVCVAVWDSRTGQCVATNTVTDTNPEFQKTDRAAVAVDALDSFCVVFCLQPTAVFTNRQVAARVGQFNGTNVSFLTPSFFPFVNHDPNGSLGTQTFNPTVAMTTRQIFIAAIGNINSTNNLAPADTANMTQVYTVINTPVPVAAPIPNVSITTASGNATISWNSVAGLFTLQSTLSLSPSAWIAVAPQPPIVPVSTLSLNQMTFALGTNTLFYRLAR
jgi:hypothetical protein